MFDTFFLEKNRWILWLPVFLIAGIHLFFSIKIYSFVIFFILLLQFFTLIKYKTNVYLKLLLLPIFFFTLGYTRAMYLYNRFNFPAIKYNLGYVNISGNIINTNIKKSSNNKLYNEITVEVEKIEQTDKSFKKFMEDKNFKNPKKVLIRLNDFNERLEKSHVKVNAILYPITKKQFFSDFDFEEYYYFKEIGGIGYKGKILENTGKSTNKTIFDRINKFRYKFGKNILNILDKESGTIITTLTTGNKKIGDKNTIQLMNNVGLAHLLTISGIHMMILVAITTIIIKHILLYSEKIALKYDVFKISAFASLIINLIYLLLGGFTVSAIRAYLMSIIVLFSIIFERFNNPLRSVFFVLCIIAFINPYSIYNAGFQMSFGAVIALIASYEYLLDKKGDQTNKIFTFIYSHSLARYIFSLFFTSIVATIATMPFSLYHFNIFSFYNIIANCIAVPIVSFLILPLSMLSLPLYFINLEKIVLLPAGFCANIIIKVAKYIVNIDNSILILPSPNYIAMYFMILGGIWFCIWRENWRIYGLYVYCIGLFLIFFQKQPDIIIDHKNNFFVVTDYKNNIYPVEKINKHILKIWLTKFGKEKSHNYKELLNNNCNVNDKKCIKLEKNENSYTLYKNNKAITIKYNYRNKIYISNYKQQIKNKTFKVKTLNYIDFIYLK